MSNKSRFKYLALAAALVATGPAAAGLVGQQVTGSLTFVGDPSNTNYFDPNATIPPGIYIPSSYLNATQGITVTIDGSATEFGYDDADNLNTANFTDDQLIITDLVRTTTLAWQMTFTSVTPGLFTSISLFSEAFTPDLTYSLVGDTITISFAGTNSPGFNTTTFSIGSQSQSVPEPTILALMSLGLAVIGLGKYRRVPPALA